MRINNTSTPSLVFQMLVLCVEEYYLEGFSTTTTFFLPLSIYSIQGTARKGLGLNRGAGNQAPDPSNDVEAKEELAKEEKGKGNRAFQDKRFEDAIKHFSVCIKLDEVRVCVFFVAVFSFSFFFPDIKNADVVPFLESMQSLRESNAAGVGETAAATRAVYHSNRSAAYVALKVKTHQNSLPQLF